MPEGHTESDGCPAFEVADAGYCGGALVTGFNPFRDLCKMIEE
jgi:hypothetical protein